MARMPGGVGRGTSVRSMTAFVTLEPDTAPGVATLRLDRPKVNAVNDDMLRDIVTLCGELAKRRDVRAVVLTGGRRHFAAGADIDQFPQFEREDALAFSHRFNNAALAIEDLPQITISAINGFALGGGLELALATDFRIAASDATLGLPEILLGIIPGGGGTQRLARLAGVTAAKDLIYSGRSITAEEAQDRNIISSIHDPDDVYTDAVAMAEQYARGPASLQLAKAAIVSGYHLTVDEAVRIEAERFADAFTTTDAEVGVRSFLDNGPGKAEFTGT